MTHVTHSASVSIGQLFGTIGSAASAITTSFSAINHAADVLAATSENWSAQTRERIAHERVTMSAQIRMDSAMRLGQRIKDRDSVLAKDPDLLRYYNEALALLGSKLDKEQTQS